jgi:hypothetical protein
LHLVGSSVLLYLIDDARSNKNQIIVKVTEKIRKKLNDYITTLQAIFGFIVGIIY